MVAQALGDLRIFYLLCQLVTFTKHQTVLAQYIKNTAEGKNTFSKSSSESARL